MAHLRQAMPGFPKARYNLGWELFQVGRLDEAIAQLQRFVRDEPVDAAVLSAWETMGRAFVAQHRWPEAIEGRALASQGRLDEARDQFQRALRLDSTYADAWDDLARLEGGRSSRPGSKK
jgi:predicted Zn-dependent protease